VVCAGKVDRKLDGQLAKPTATAARELEEESHGLIPAAAVQEVLERCPVYYCNSSKMAVYFMRYVGGQQLPELMQQRLAGEGSWLLLAEQRGASLHVCDRGEKSEGV
jgi:hypothetical protein